MENIFKTKIKYDKSSLVSEASSTRSASDGGCDFRRLTLSHYSIWRKTFANLIHSEILTAHISIFLKLQDINSGKKKNIKHYEIY